MKIAVMQPYFLPYIGYFQLMSAVDRFVLFDNVQYVRQGWINRNRILQHNQPGVITPTVMRLTFIRYFRLLKRSSIVLMRICQPIYVTL